MRLNVTGRKESYKPKNPKGTLRYFRLKRMAWETPSKNELQIGVVCEEGNPTAHDVFVASPYNGLGVQFLRGEMCEHLGNQVSLCFSQS